ncbi:hypothetical protein VNI00_001615 [Paramarasmius palmivorus]|uniref:D-serine dehydratase n=1 Tax=Paramarasmius palmivorus TaxID=297713 RepID=A0AAW0E476_9AGAR
MKQTITPCDAINLPDKQTLVASFAGKTLDDLRTPAFVIDRNVFAKNCAKMHEKAISWGAAFRAHLKTHKTAEGTRLQLHSEAGKTDAVVVSTLMEAWQVVKAGLFRDGVVKDLLYGLPIAPNKIEDLSNLWDEIAPSGGIVRVLIDHPDQVKFLEQFEKERSQPRKWSVFVKVDGGQKRAGVPTASPFFEPLIKTLFSSPAISVYGFYCHAGNAYASTSLTEASSFLSGEVDAVNTAAGSALEVLAKSNINAPSQPFILSVGSTPTAHAASAETRAMLSSLLHGTLELHAGNYPMLDLQQEHTTLIDSTRIAQRVRTTVVSYYPGRGANGTDEAVVDGGAIAFSKDTGPSGGFGRVIGTGWQLGRMSQEHGILTRTTPVDGDKLEVGDLVDIVGQHACLIAAAYPWYYIVDSSSGDEKSVVDVWVPWKGW